MAGKASTPVWRWDRTYARGTKFAPSSSARRGRRRATHCGLLGSSFPNVLFLFLRQGMSAPETSAAEVTAFPQAIRDLMEEQRKMGVEFVFGALAVNSVLSVNE